MEIDENRSDDGSKVSFRDEKIFNCLSVDLEGFVESNTESFRIDAKYIDKKKENFEIEKNTDYFIEFLSEHNIKATFFCVGRIAFELPNLIKKIAKEGHEIGCHSFEHLRIFNLKKDEFKEKLTVVKSELENISGERVLGFRAPDFSITKSSLWALDILKETGFVYDSSIYPIGMHDVYGIASINRFIHHLPNGLIEFPLSTFQIFGRTLPFGGGGYFRLFPVSITKFLMKRLNQNGHPCMIYIHPYEVGPVIPEIKELSFYRKFRHYYNCYNGDVRLSRVLREFNFRTIYQLLKIYI